MKKKLKSLLRPYWKVLQESGRTLQRLVAIPLRKLPMSSEVMGSPKGFYPSTAEWASAQEKGIFLPVYPAETLYRSMPGTLDKEIHWKFRLEYERELPSSFVAVVPGGRAWVNKGAEVNSSAIITASDRVLSDISHEFNRTGYNHSVFTQWKLPPINYIKGKVAVLSLAKGNIYFHWMTDLLPKIELLRRSGIAVESIDKFVVNRYSQPFQKASLTALGIPPDKMIESSLEHHIKADTLLVPSLPSLPGNVPQWVCEFLRKEFLDREVAIKSDSPKRIYISRGTAKYRQVINEEDIISLLKTFGFQRVTMESLSIPEQAALFNSAQAIVAPHGAGLTNLVFCEPETKVIEFFSPQYVNVCYYALSDLLKLNYYYLKGEGQEPPEGIDPHLAGEDISVSLDSLSSLLKLAGIEQA